MNNENVKDWKLYQAGLAYNQELHINGKGYYETIDANLAFVQGEQWRNVPDTDLPKPVFNIIKRVGQYKIASLASDNISVKFEPIEYREDGSMDNTIVASEIATQEVKNVFDKFGLETKQRDLLMDGFTTGDYAVHQIFNPNVKVYEGQFGDFNGDIETEIIDGQNVIVGNPNIKDIQKQPWVIIPSRELVSELQKQARRNKEDIVADEDTTYMAGDFGKIEIKADEYGKALACTMYKKIKGIVYVSKFTRDAYLYENVKTGMTRYPIAFGNYEPVKNSYHGRAEVSGIIPNQISINKLFAMVIYHTSLTAFPTLIYDSGKITSWTSQLGIPVGLKLQQGERIGDVAQYLETGSIGQAVTSIIELLVNYTKELLGVSDASLGNIDPKNTSAIIAVQKANAVPLENVRAGFYSFIKEFALNTLDMIKANYGIRPIVVEQDGMRNVIEYDFNNLKNVCFNTKLDVGASGYYSDVASNSTLDNLLNAQLITLVQYLERIDDNLIPKKQELIEELKGQIEGNQAQEYEQMMAFFETLPPETQMQLKQLPDDQFEQAVMELMGGTNEIPS